MITTYRAARATWSSYYDNVPRMNSTWDVYASRVARYDQYDDHLNNTAYKRLQATARAVRNDLNMYRFIRGLIEPVAREIDICAAKCYGGTLDMENFKGGAIPLILSDDRLKEPIRQLFVTSNMGVEKSVLVRSAALYGDVVGLIVDDPRKQHVSIEFPHPRTLVEATFDGRGNVKEATFEYQQQEQSEGGSWRTFTFTKIITAEKFKTFKDGKPFAFYENASGELVAEWDNPYPFVPVAVGHWKKLPGLTYGVNAFYHALGKIDELNDGYSVIRDHLRRALNPQWAAIGVAKPKASDDPIDASTDLRDDERLVYAPAGATFQSLVHNVDMAGAIAAHQVLMTEVYDDLPELAMGKLRASGNLTAPGVTAGYSDAVDRLTDGNGNLDDFLVRLTQMGITVGAIGRYDGYRGFNEGSYDAGDLAFTVRQRDIIKDELSKDRQLQAFEALGHTEKVLEMLNVSEEDIQLFMAQKQKQDALLQATQPGQLPTGQPTPLQLTAGEPQPEDDALDDMGITEDDARRWNTMFNDIQKATGAPPPADKPAVAEQPIAPAPTQPATPTAQGAPAPLAPDGLTQKLKDAEALLDGGFITIGQAQQMLGQPVDPVLGSYYRIDGVPVPPDQVGRLWESKFGRGVNSFNAVVNETATPAEPPKEDAGA